MSRLIADKHVKVMADYAATGIWTKTGSMAALADLPVDPNVYFQLGHWQHWFEARPNMEEIPYISGFVRYGLGIAREIRRQLPGWTVEYFDEQSGRALIEVRLWFDSKEVRG